jgi:hypothetical protein
VQPAFDAANAFARAGEHMQAMMWLNRAVDDGLTSAALLDGEPDLAPLRALPGWYNLRARVH